MANEVYLTAEGLQQLKEELQELSGVGRREIAARIKEARDFGDLSENAEYDAAKNDQARLESRIAVLEEKLRNAVVITSSDTTVVSLGTRVTVTDAALKTTAEYIIVGSTEAKPAEGRLSNESPVGRALVGAKKGQTVTVASPRGERKLKITKIEPVV